MLKPEFHGITFISCSWVF